ncbi:MAG: hypothetical protein IJX39_01000 [Clostridia bacterium]|nr:hypothetical protein [Clostridia bacterium]
MSVHQKPQKAARRHRRTATEQEGAPTLSALMKSVLVALPITVTVGLLLLLLSSVLLLSAKDPDRYHTGVAFTLLYLTAFIGGAIATRLQHRRAPLFCGLGEALLLLLFITVLAFCLPDAWGHSMSGALALLTRLLLLPASLAGALLAARQKKKTRRHH